MPCTPAPSSAQASTMALGLMVAVVVQSATTPGSAAAGAGADDAGAGAVVAGLDDAGVVAAGAVVGGAVAAGLVATGVVATGALLLLLPLAVHAAVIRVVIRARLSAPYVVGFVKKWCMVHEMHTATKGLR
jgi:hypothetical protein